jgi:predicted DsbA family dithiol-disulfide isomerase
MNSDADRELVEREDSLARKIGIQGVPTFFVGGRILITGAQDAESIARTIDRAVEEAQAAVATA